MSSIVDDGSFVILNAAAADLSSSMDLKSCSILNITDSEAFVAREEKKVAFVSQVEDDIVNHVTSDEVDEAEAETGVSHLETLRCGSSLPIQEDGILTGSQARKCQSLENGITLGAAVIKESINKVVEDSEEDSEAAREELAVPANCDVSAFEGYLRALREENERLKQVLECNNEAMKRQLKIVQKWQEEVHTTRVAYNGLKEESEAVVEKLKNENETLKEKLRDAGETKSTNTDDGGRESKATGSFFWDDMSMEMSEMRQIFERVQFLEDALEQKEKLLEEADAKVTPSKDEIKQLNLQIAELRIQKIKEQNVVDLLKNQLEIYTNDFKKEEVARKRVELEIGKLEVELEKMREERAVLLEKLELGNPVLALGLAERLKSRMHRHHKRQSRKSSRHSNVSDVGEPQLESYTQFRAT